MASEIRVNKIENRSGLGTVTFADTGVDLAGIVTATTFSGSGASLTALPAANITGTLPAISGANLTNLAAANLTGTIADARFPATLPAASAANLTSIPAANITGTLPALTAANLTNIPAANLVGVCTSGLTKTGGFGKILQVVHTTKNSVSSYSSSGNGTFDDAPGLSLNITPTSSSSTILIDGILMLSGQDGYHYTARLRRDSTTIGAGDNGSQNSVREGFSHWYLYPSNGQYTIFPMPFLHEDSPNTTSQITYKVQIHSYGGGTVYINRTHAGQNDGYNGVTISSIRAMEIAA